MNPEPALPAFALHAIGGSSLLAHQGGWDEILLVVVPLLVVGGLLYLANRQVSAKLAAEQGRSPQEQSPPDDHDQNQA